MTPNRAVALLIGVGVCAVVLALHPLGVFVRLGGWLEGYYGTVLKPVEGGLKAVAWLHYGYYTVLAFLSAWVCLELEVKSRKWSFLLGAVFLTVSLSPLLALGGVLFEPFSGGLAVVLAGLVAMGVSGTEKWQRQHRLRRYFVGRLSEASFDELVGRREVAEELTSRREVTVVTCRLINHGELAAEMEPAEMERFSSSFLKVVAEFLVTKGGYLDACNVHRVRVFFGYPVKDEVHAQTAAEVALELRQRIVNLTQEMEARWHKRPQIGVSLSSGEATCGLFGFRQFEFFTAVGEGVGFGDRLCAVNAVYGTQVLMAATTYQAAQELVEVRPMEMVFAPKLAPVSEVYELLAMKDGLSEAEQQARDAFWKGVIHLRKGAFEEARVSFAEAVLEGREDPALAYFMRRAEAGLKGGEESMGASGASRHVRMLLPQ